jgi:hypothetical protein
MLSLGCSNPVRWFASHVTLRLRYSLSNMHYRNTIEAHTESGGLKEFDLDEYDAVMVVINPKTGALLASQIMPHRWPHLAAPGVLYGSRELENGESEIAIWDLKLVSKGSRKRR